MHQVKPHFARGPAAALAAADQRIGDWLQNRARQSRNVLYRRRGDDGFVLLETVVAIGLISVVMAAFTTFFINTVAYTSLQRATQTATQIANSTIESIRALPASDPLNGHDASSVLAQFSAAPSAVTPWLSGMTQATDPTALTGSGLTAGVPTAAVTQTVNNVVYKVNSYFGTCVIATGVTQSAACAVGAATSGTGYLRVVVAVTWAGSRCPATGCAYVTSTLLSTVDDPLFQLTQSAPAAPSLTNPGAQTSAVGDVVILPASFQAVPTVRFAIAAGTLPAGLFLDAASGLISGTPSAVTPTTQITLRLTDGFGRVATAGFTWTVLAALTATAPEAQASFVGTAVTLTLPAATGGTPAYTWSDPGATLPPGLTLSTVENRARITGTPTTRGVYLVSLTVTDTTGTRRSTVTFTWTIDYPPMVAANPGPQTSTVGTSSSLTLSVTGGSGSFSWSGGASLPAGLSLSSAGVISGTATTAGVKSVALIVTDTKSLLQQSVSFTWTVLARPTVTSPGSQSMTVGAAVAVQLVTTCPNAPCSYAMINGPATFGIGSTGLLSGTVTSSAQTFSNVTIVVTDSAGATGTSAVFAVTVNAAPSITTPETQVVAPGVADSLNVAALARGGTAPLTYSAANLPSWLTLNTSTGLISGTAPATSITTTGITVTVRDVFGISATTNPFTWIVGTPPTAPLAVAVVNGDLQVTASWTAPTSGPVTSYTATVSPGGASCTTAGLSCVITGLTNGVIYSLTVTATNVLGTGPSSTAVRAIPYPAGVMSLANGMTLWLDGADPTVVFTSSLSACSGTLSTTTTKVGCWKDKSGSGLNFNQATATSQPGISTWNGLPAVNFADTTDVLASINATGIYRTVFVAAKVNNPATTTIVNLFGQAATDYNVQVGSSAGRNSPNTADWSSATGTPALNWFNGAQAVNGASPQAMITSDQAAANKTFTASVSNTVTSSRGLIGQVGDVINFNKVLTTAQRRSVEEYLARKWAVSITPQAPPSVTASRLSTSSATVSWAAPTFNGGAAITGYTVTASPGGRTCTTTTALTCAVTLLTTGTAYTFTVTATNAVGIGPASAASGTVTP